jgi:glutaconate CoA-transferase, subunit A
MAQAARTTFLSAEKIVPTAELASGATFHTLRISRLMTDGVIEAPNGAHFTECPPDYGRDEAFQKEYAATAASPEAWADFSAKYLEGSEADYQRAIGADR